MNLINNPLIEYKLPHLRTFFEMKTQFFKNHNYIASKL